MKIAILNSATPNSSFGEADTNSEHFKERCYFLVNDSYDFSGNSATEIVGDDFNEWFPILENLGRCVVGDETKDAIKASYITKEIDGIEYFDEWRAKLVIDYQSTILSEADLYEIEDAYEKVFKRLLKGDWMSAKNKLSQVTIGGAVTQARHDIIVGEISSYVSANY